MPHLAWSALTNGTNCGFVTVAPTTNPGGSTDATWDTRTHAIKVVAPANGTITEIGFYSVSNSEAADAEYGIYDDDVANGRAGNLLATSGTITKSSGTGWKSAPVSYSFTSGVTYWIAVQIDDTATRLDSQYGGSSGNSLTYKSSQTALTNPHGAYSSISANNIAAIYALYTLSAHTNTINNAVINNATIN